MLSYPPVYLEILMDFLPELCIHFFLLYRTDATFHSAFVIYTTIMQSELGFFLTGSGVIERFGSN
jgi:hypothetical protein